MAGDDGSVVRQLYLSLYNWVTFFGWLVVDLPIFSSQSGLSWIGHGPVGLIWVLGFEFCRLEVLFHGTLALLGGGHEAVYDAVKLPLLFSQTAALTEVMLA